MNDAMDLKFLCFDENFLFSDLKKMSEEELYQLCLDKPNNTHVYSKEGFAKAFNYGDISDEWWLFIVS